MATMCDEVERYDLAVEYYEKFLAVVKEVNDTLAEALAYNHLGIDYFYLGSQQDLKQAIHYHTKHDQMTQDLGKTKIFSIFINKLLGSRFIANCNLGITWAKLRQHMTAITHFRQSLGFSVQSGDLEAQSLVCNFLARTSASMRDFPIAKVYLERRLKLAEQLGDLKVIKRFISSYQLVYLLNTLINRQAQKSTNKLENFC
jgi:tetratricopeptide (TPR) repeat protein